MYLTFSPWSHAPVIVYYLIMYHLQNFSCFRNDDSNNANIIIMTIE